VAFGQPERLDTVLVSATRAEQSQLTTPASITIITREDIERRGVRNVSEAVRGAGGLQVRDLFGDGSSAVIDMRGFGPTAGSNTLVLVDGRVLNNSSDLGTPDLNTVSIKDVERIEIVQGSAGTLFGNQAVGGVVNIITRSPDALRAEVELGGGSYRGRAINASVTDRLDGGLGYRLSGQARASDNYRDNNAVDYRNLAGRLDYEHDRGRLFGEYQYVSDDVELPGSLFEDEVEQDRRQSADVFSQDFSDTKTHIGRLGLRQTLAGPWWLEGEYTYRDVDRDFRTSFRAFGQQEPAVQDREVQTLNPRLIGIYPLRHGDLEITAGADLEGTDYELSSSIGRQEVKQRIGSYYAQAVLPLARHWSMTVGGRYARVDNDITESFSAPDGVSLDDDVKVGTAGLSFRPSPAWRMFLRVDGNYRLAKVDEHTNIVFGAPVGLNNQTGVSYELGLEYQTSRTRLKLVGYRLDLDNEISFDASAFSNTNLDSTRRVGALLEGSVRPIRSLRLGGSYSYVDSEVTDGPFDGKDIPLVARHTGWLYADQQATRHLSLYGEVSAVGKRVLGGDFANEFRKLDAYALVNLQAAYEWQRWRASLRLNNLLDKAYSEDGAIGLDAFFTRRDAYFPSPERNVWLSARYVYD
jgi:iron complex outermembrane receptor protein